MKHVQSDSTILQNLTNHLECPSAVEFIVKMIATPAPHSDWIAKSDLVSLVYQKLSKSTKAIISSYSSESASQHVDLENAVREILTSLNWDHPLTQKFASADSCKLLFKNGFEDGNSGGFKVAMKVSTYVSSFMIQSHKKVIEEFAFVYEGHWRR